MYVYECLCICACLGQQLFSTSLLLVLVFKDSSAAFSLYFFYVYGCFSCHYMFGLHMHSACRGQKRALYPMELDLKMIVSYYVGAWSRIQILWKCTQCF